MDGAVKAFLLGLVDKYGLVGFFLAMVISYGSVLLPSIGGFILVAANKVFPAIQIILIGGFGAAIGESIAYILARETRLLLNAEQKKTLQEFKTRINSWGVLFIFGTAAVPLFPFDLVSLAAGLVAFNFTNYFIAVLLGRWIYSAIVVLLGHAIF